MSISSKRSTVRPVELSQTMAPEEMLAVEELSVMQEADVLDMEAREKASKQSAEDEALQVAQVDMPTEYLENPAAAAEVMSDVGEAGLIGEEGISRWEAQEVAFAGAGGGSGAGFWGGMGGFGAAAGGIAVGGKLHQDSMSSDSSSGGFSGDTSVVIFDMTSQSSSSHSGRTFDAGVDYNIYVLVDASTMEADIAAINAGAVDVTWNGGENLGAGDAIHLVITNATAPAPYTYSSISNSFPSSWFWSMSATYSTSVFSNSWSNPSSFGFSGSWTGAWMTQTVSLWDNSGSGNLSLSLTHSERFWFSSFAITFTSTGTTATGTGGIYASNSTSARVQLIQTVLSGSGSHSGYQNAGVTADLMTSMPAGLLTTQGLA